MTTNSLFASHAQFVDEQGRLRPEALRALEAIWRRTGGFAGLTAADIPIVDAAGDFTATEVEGALAELQADAEADAAALAAHLVDAVDAHDASAISFTPVGTIAATDTQTAVAEVATDAAAALSAHEAAADPHPGYLTPAEGNAAYQPLDADLTTYAANVTAGLWAYTGAGTGAARTITGTAGEISVANGAGTAGNPTISLPSPMTFTGKVVNGGFFNGLQQWGVANIGVGAFDMRHVHNGTLTGNVTLSFDLNDASRGFDMLGNLTVSAAADVSGTNTGDETLSSIGTKLDSAAAKNPVVDADTFIILDSADGDAVKQFSWLNLKATAKTYFDTLYQPLAAALTSWASVVRAAGFDTWAATPSSANLRSLVTDESGTGALLFQSGDLGTPTAGVATNLTGTAASLTAGIASTVSVADEASDTTCFPLFGTAATGNLQPKTNANITFNSSTGVFTSASLVATTADINGGTVDNATIGATTATTGRFTTIESTGNVGFGSAPSSLNNLSVTGSLTGGTSSNGMRNIPVVQSGVTTLAQYFVTNGSTAAASFTCAALHHYVAIQGTIGASSTVTVQRGFLADSTLTGATTNYGFVGNIAASGTSRYNFYAGGTAPNHFTGNTTFGAKFGYGVTAGVGGTVTQATNKSTGVTLNTATGEITMNGAALAAATIVSFTMTNSTIEAADVLILNHVTTGTRGAYSLNAQCAAGSAIIYVRNNTAGSLSEAIVIRFAAVRGATA